jgi:hypothetical protein
MSAGFLRSIRALRSPLVFRDDHEYSAEKRKKVSLLSPELVFRKVPGKSDERRRHSQRR